MLPSCKLSEVARGIGAQGVVEAEQDAPAWLPVYLDLELWEDK